jgi:hypothetical protein
MEQKVDRHAADDGPPMMTTLDRPMEESGRVIGRMAFSSPQPQSHSDGPRNGLCRQHEPLARKPPRGALR